MTILDSLCRRVRIELFFPLDVNSARLFKLVMSRWPQEPIAVVCSVKDNHPRDQNLLTRALYFGFCSAALAICSSNGIVNSKTQFVYF